MAALVRLLRRLRRAESGAELLEFAIAFPLLALLTAGIIDFGLLFQRFEVVTNAAREGARVGILPNYAAVDVQARIASYFAASGLTDPYPAPTVAYNTVAIAPGGPTINVVQVTVLYPYQFLFLGPVAGLVGGVGPGTINLTASAQMRREVPAVGP